MSLILVTPPAVEPVLVADAKAILNIGSEVSDTVMGAFVTAARQMIDGSTGWINRCLVTQTWKLTIDFFPFGEWQHDHGFHPEFDRHRHHHHRRHDAIVIPLSPVQDIEAVTYLDPEGEEQTLDPSNYSLLQGEPSLVVRALNGTWPSTLYQPDAISITFKAGYGDDGSAVPQAFRAAIALQASHLRSLSAQNLYIGGETVEGIGSTNYVVGSGAATAIDGAVQSLLEPYRVQLP